MKLLRRSLFARLFVYFLAMTGLFGLLMYFYVSSDNRSRRDSEVKHFRLEGEYLLEGISSNVNIVLGLLSWDKSALEGELEVSYPDSPAAYTIIYNEYSKVAFEKYKQELDPKTVSFQAPSMQDDNRNVEISGYFSRDGVHYLDFIHEMRVTNNSLVPAGQDSARVGWVRIGIPLSGLEHQLYSSKMRGLGLIGLVVAMGVAVLAVTVRSVMPPINRLSKAARRIGAGELDVVLDITSEDEIGLLTATFNDMSKSIRDNNMRNKQMIGRVSQVIDSLGANASQLLSVSTQQAEGASQQAEAVEELGATVHEISATAAGIADNTGQVRDNAQKTSQTCRLGAERMDGTVQRIVQASSSFKDTTDKILELHSQAEKIGGVIGIIEEISEQTALLALNAEIEAAGAGESGKRFKVVAAEVRRLSRRAIESAEFIRALIFTVQDSINGIVMLAESGKKAMDDGEHSVNQMGEYFRNIMAAADSTRDSIAQINMISNQQASSTKQIIETVSGVETVAREVATGAQHIEQTVTDLEAMAAKLKRMIEEV